MSQALTKKQQSQEASNSSTQKELAIFEYQKIQKDEKSIRLHEISKKHEISKSTLRRLVKPGACSITQFNIFKRLLSSSKDQTLLKYIQELEECEFPLL